MKYLAILLVLPFIVFMGIKWRGWLWVFKDPITQALSLALLFFVGICILTGCATDNDIIYKRDCRMEIVTKRCIEVPMGPQRDRR